MASSEPVQTTADTDDEGPNTVVNAAIGAAVTVLTAGFLPFSPLVGGGVAGYLEGEDTDDGLRAGALSGAFAAVPLLVVGLLALFVLPVVDPPTGTLLVAVVFGLVVLLAVYSLGLGALGGYLGAYLDGEL